MALKILVTAKRVEDPESKIKVKPDGSGIVTEGVNYKMNPFDEIAVEEALRLKEKHGGEVVVASIGGDKSVTEIRAALAMGADRGVFVKHDGPLDPVVVSTILAKVFEQEKPDLVILGKQSIDDDQNQAGQYLAALLRVVIYEDEAVKTELEFLRQRRRLTALSNSGGLFWAWIPASAPPIVRANIWGDDVPPALRIGPA